jgi:hydrocephalus-inducing protein
LALADAPVDTAAQNESKNPQQMCNPSDADASTALEFEIDRNFLCEVLLEKERDALSRQKVDAKAGETTNSKTTQGSKGMVAKLQLREMPPITAAYYVCDFGNIVLGQSGKKQVTIFNCYNEPVSFTINRKMLLAHGYTVTPEKARNLPAGQSLSLELTSFPPKDGGKEDCREELDWIIPLKDGPLYEVKLISNFVLPDLVLSPEVVDFGRVLVGQRKRVTVRLKNVKAVPVEWEYKAPKSKYGKALPPSETTFTFSPSSGKLQPGGTMWVTISFTPNATKAFSQKLALRINDNPNKKLVSLCGQGDALRVDIQPADGFQLGPILPTGESEEDAEKSSIKEFFLCNPTDYPIEVYSVDFDPKYIEEEDMLRQYNKYDAWNLTELPVRLPGCGTWRDVTDNAVALQKKMEREQLREKLRQEGNADGEEVPEDDVAEEPPVHGEEAEEVAVEMDPSLYPYRVPTEDRVNVVFIGVSDTGKSEAAKSLAVEGGRRLLSMDEVIDWALSGPPSLQTQKDLQIRSTLLEVIATHEAEHEKLEAEREDDCKKKKVPFNKMAASDYPFAIRDIADLIWRRTQLPDCGCGIVIGQFDSRFLAKDKVSDAIFMALRAERIMVIDTALGGHLGFSAQEPVALGQAAAVVTALSPEGEEQQAEVDAHLQFMGEGLRTYYLELQEFLTTRHKSAEDKLQELKDAREAAKQAEDAGAAAEEAEDADGSFTRQTSSGLGAQVKDLEAKIQSYTDTLGRLNAIAEDAAKLDGVTHEVKQELLMVDASAVKALAVAKSEERLKSTSANSKRSMKFDPPGRPDETIRPGTNGEKPEDTIKPDEGGVDGLDLATGGNAGSDDKPSNAMTLLPLALDNKVSPTPFAQLLATLQKVVPAPLIPDEPPLPPPTFVQIVSLPQSRLPRVAQSNFSIMTARPGTAGEASEETGAVGKAAGEEADQAGVSAQTRWVIEPHGQQRLELKFSAKEIGTFITSLTFEVVGGINGNAAVSAVATGVTAFPAINSDPRNVFMRRIKSKPASGYASKQFVSSLGVYDFGPLLAGRSPPARIPAEAEEGQPATPLDAYVRQHMESFRITNNSLFKANVKLCLGSSAEAADPKAFNEEFPFIVEPEELELEIDETQEISVSCFPTREGTYADKIVVTVEHNPEPVEFQLSAIGSLPKVNMEMTELDFDCLLLKQKATNYIRFSNICAVPVRWKLNPNEKGVPEAFLIDSMDGTLAVGEEKSIAVTFRADEPQMFTFPLTLQIGDSENLKPLEDANQIEVRAEAFNVDVVPEFQDGGRGLDFGNIQVSSTVEQKFNVTNNGKYAVTYEMKIRRKAIRDILEVEIATDENGVATLGPGQKAEVLVRIKPTQEMQCPDGHRGSKNEELELLVYEAKNPSAPVRLDLPPISLSFRAFYNSFSVTPPRGLNFGPVRIGESGTRDFDIYNDGLFKFDWFLFDPSRPGSTDSKQRDAGDKGELSLGPYKIKPAQGVLGPKESAKVVATFVAADDGDFDCKFAFHVDGMPEISDKKPGADPLEQNTAQNFYSGGGGGNVAPGFKEYLLSGQSCTPGIDTENMSTLFEEHFVARSSEDAIATAGRIDIRVYQEDDKLFSFGPVIVNGPGSESHGGTDTAKFRITNPKAIPCDVKFELKPRGSAKDAVMPFELSTDHLHIPAHEYRYIKVRFRPPSLQTYSASFEATVPDGKDPKTNFLQFELRGDGTVPTVSLDGPPIFGDTGGDCKFGKLKVGQSHTIDFVLRNDGIIPATARCDCKPSANFSIVCPKSIPLEPKASHPLQVSFTPSEKGEFTTSLHLYTLNNQFEDTTIQFSGEGYMDDVCWDLQDVARPKLTGDDAAAQAHLPPAPDQLSLGEVALGAEVRVTFYIGNTSRDPIRFQFPEQLPPPFDNCLSILPSVGHVLPRSRKPVTFTFKPTAKLSETITLPASLASITYDGEPEDWDDSMRSVAFPCGDAGSKDGDSKTPTPPDDAGAASRQGSKTVEGEGELIVDQEPKHQIVEGSERELPLTIAAIADERVYECSVDQLTLQPTVLYQTKTHRFSVKNPSTISMPFEWQFVPPSASKSTPGIQAYKITPTGGVIAPGVSQEFTLRFSPKEVEPFKCRLECKIPNLSKEKQPLCIALDAQAVRPWCHFELPASDYRSKRASDAPLDPKFQILEFESVGTRVKNTKRFYVLNPTSESYEFTWMPEQSATAEEKEDAFRCMTKRGTIYPGKKYEMVFEYLPTSIGTHESFWHFQVLNKDARQSFLVVGTVKEPRVGMDRPNVNFNRLLLGAQARETVHVVNKEHIPFSFSFAKSSYETEGQVPMLSVTPTSGVVGPGASFPVEITFTPTEEKCFNYNVLCNVKRQAQPILLNVKGEGYKIHTKLVIEEKERGERELLPGVRELLDFGTLQVQEKRTFTLRLSSPTFKRPDADSKGKTQDELDELPNVNFDFIWQLRNARGGMLIPRADAAPYITISPLQGRGTQEEETIITVEYCPTDTHSLDGAQLRMLIPSGPGESGYNLELAGCARRPTLDLSVSNHDFGPCFVSRRGASASEPTSPSRRNTPFEQLDLIITNRDGIDHWLSTTFEKTPYLDVQLVASMIEAGSSLTVPIIFTPREYVDYRERIEFVINDCFKSYVNIRGRGCQLHLELASIDMQNVDFGTTVGNQPVSRAVKIVNRSLRSVDFVLHDPETQLVDKGVSWTPAMPVTLRPKEQMPVDLRFNPEFRIAPFKLPLVAKCNFGHDIHLLTISGTCHTAEVKLSEHSILFGDVVFQSTAVRKVHLHNFGDLGVKFRFEVPPKFAPFFSIEPSEGFASPHDDVVLQVKFHPSPKMASDPGRPKKIRCHLDPSYQHDPIELIVQGHGIDQPEGATKLLEFSTEVRETKTLEFTFPPDGAKNTTSEAWKINPVVKTEMPAGAAYWFVPAELTVPAGGSTVMEISYRPLTMTLREEDKLAASAEADGDAAAPVKKQGKKKELLPEKHMGKIFISTPDGNAFVLNLEGVALPRKEAKKISADVQCKKPHMQAIEVSNWLNEAQRFNVKISLIEPSDAREEIKLHGVETFDLPAGASKEYKFNVYAYREGAAKARVVLTSLKTEEFLAYEVSFKFVAPDTLQVIDLAAACRQTATHPISVLNPLSTPVSFKCEASLPELRFSPALFVVPPNSEGSVDVLFRPVVAGSGDATLKLSSAELGDYPYTVRYDSSPAGLEKTIVFKAPLGSTDTVQSFRFLHYAQKPAQYAASIEAAPGHKGLASDFIVESKDIKAGAASEDGVEVVVDIRFQPSALGEIRGLLVLSSPDGGDYKALLVGYTQPPQPQGPFDIAKGKDGKIDFNNPFEENAQFSVQVDNPNFVVGKRSFRLDAKKSESIIVQFKGDKQQGGRLIVSAPKVSTPWIFFLKGTV